MSKLLPVIGFAGFAIIAASGNAFATGDNISTLQAQCEPQLNLSTSGCTCLVSAAQSLLNSKQLDFVVSAIARDAEALDTAKGALNDEELIKVTTFMSEEPSKCENR